MKVVLVAEVPTELRGKFLELRKVLKEEYGIDLLGEDAGHVLDVFSDTFIPLVRAYQEGKVKAMTVAVAVQEYSERLNLLTSVIMYASKRYGIDFRDDQLFKVLEHNMEGVSKEVQRMNHEGKSLEDAYRYMLKQVATVADVSKELQ